MKKTFFRHLLAPFRFKSGQDSYMGVSRDKNCAQSNLVSLPFQFPHFCRQQSQIQTLAARLQFTIPTKVT
jgi:hypothetical protein